MIEKLVPASAGMSTVVVGGGVVKVTFEGHSVNYVFIRHVSGEILASRSPNVADSVDGTVKLSAGGYRFDVSAPVVYISGSGVCEVSASALGDFPFKIGSKGGEGGSSSQGLVLLKEEEMAYTATSSYVFLIGDEFNVSDYKMFICIIKNIGSVAFTPKMSVVKFRGDGDNVYQVQWLRDDMFEIKSISGAVLSYFGYQLFGIRG